MAQVSVDESSLPGYRSVLEGAGLIDLSARGKIRVTGPDRASFLHAMISNDVEKLEVPAGRYATFLTATGKLVADFHVFKLDDYLLIDIDTALSATLRESLEKFVIMDDVTLTDSSEWGHLSLQGPLSVKIAAAVLGVEVPSEPLRMAPIRFAGEDGWVIRKNLLSDTGCEILLPRAATDSLKALLLERSGVSEVGETAAETLRVERGVGRFGVDFDHRNNPLEARLDDAISFTKGCYIGQEVVAKATYIGGVGRLLTGLRLDGDEVPARGAKVMDGKGKEVGAVSSAVFSPRLGRPVGLALIRRAAAQPATPVKVELSGGEFANGETVADFLSQ